MLFWRLELLCYVGEPITDYGVQVMLTLGPTLDTCICHQVKHQVHGEHMTDHGVQVTVLWSQTATLADSFLSGLYARSYREDRQQQKYLCAA